MEEDTNKKEELKETVKKDLKADLWNPIARVLVTIFHCTLILCVAKLFFDSVDFHGGYSWEQATILVWGFVYVLSLIGQIIGLTIGTVLLFFGFSAWLDWIFEKIRYVFPRRSNKDE